MAAEPVTAPQVLPETQAVHWRPRVEATQLRRRGALWTLTTLAHVVPFIGTGILLLALEPLSLPVALAAFAHAWLIPELYAQRGANVIRPKLRDVKGEQAEQTALGLLGDLVGHEARAILQQTGVVIERGALGVWVLGVGGAVLLTNGGRRAHCWCVRVDHPDLPTADRIAHLLLALRTDEAGFATVANLSFSGATWRVRRRADKRQRPAFDAARALRPSGA